MKKHYTNRQNRKRAHKTFTVRRQASGLKKQKKKEKKKEVLQLI